MEGGLFTGNFSELYGTVRQKIKKYSEVMEASNVGCGRDRVLYLM